MSIPKIGPTGDYPRGKLNKDDEGGLNAALSTKDGMVYIHFGKPVAWLAMTKEEAHQLGELLIKRAQDA